MLQLDQKILRRLIALLGIFLQASADDALELRGHVVVEASDRVGLRVRDALDGLGRVST